MSKEISRKKEDILAVQERDPACPSALVVSLCYPGVRALRRHRRAQWLYNKGFKTLALLIASRTRRITGVDIHPCAKVGRRVFIDHATGVVIGETAEIGNDVTIYQGVTLGGTGKDKGKRHPTIEDGVMVSAGAKILGPITIGRGSKIGAGAVVLKDVPPYSTAVGVPARIIKRENQLSDLSQSKDDPILDELMELSKRLDELTSHLDQ